MFPMFYSFHLLFFYSETEEIPVLLFSKSEKNQHFLFIQLTNFKNPIYIDSLMEN